jgi:hypothetical protein
MRVANFKISPHVVKLGAELSTATNLFVLYIFTYSIEILNRIMLQAKLLVYITPPIRDLLENLIVPEVVIKFPAVYENRRYITVFTRASYCCAS